MNSRRMLLTVLAAFLCVLAIANTAPLYAQRAGSDASRAYKIGIVDLQRVMDNYEKRAVEVEKLEKEAEQRNKDFEEVQTDFEKELEQFAKMKDEMDEDERSEREADLDMRALKIQTEVRQAQGLLESKRRRMKRSLLKDIVKAVEEIGADGNYHLILEADPESRTGVLYHSTTLNMTQKVIDRLNG